MGGFACSPLILRKGTVMNRIICVLLSVCMLLCLAACQGDVEHPRESESTVSTESQDLTESTENKQGEDADEMRVLTVSITRRNAILMICTPIM